MSLYPQNSFAKLLDVYNSEKPSLAPWFDAIELYRLEYWEYNHQTRFWRPFESDHQHRFWEMHLFTEGAQRYTLGDKEFSMCSGEILLIPPLLPHRQHVDKNGVAKFALMLYIPKDLPAPYDALLRYIEQQNGLRFSYDESLLTPLELLFSSSVVNTPHLAAGMFLFLDALFGRLQMLLPDAEKVTAPCRHSDAALSDEVINYVENHISRIVTAEETAQHFFVSSRHLNRRLLANCGMTFGGLSDRIRSEFAGQLLQHTDLSVEKIGERVGFSDAGSFARFFKRVTGLAPSDFRKKHKKETAI